MAIPAGRSSAAASQAYVALLELQFSCEYAGSWRRPPSQLFFLLAARSWVTEKAELRERVHELLAREKRREADKNRIREEALARLRTAQDHLTVLSRQLSVGKHPRSAVASDPTNLDESDARHSTKRQRQN